MGQWSLLKIYGNRRMAALVGVGFASGLPYVLATDGLSAWLSSLKVDVKQIGLFSLITLPYALKFVWAPIMDRLLPPALSRLGRRRAWLIITQVLLAMTLSGMAVLGPEWEGDNLVPLAALGIALVLFSASQDIVADAYRADVLSRAELGAGAAVFVAGYRLAMMVGGALALELVRPLGWRGAYGVMAILMALSSAITLVAPSPPDPETAPQTLDQAMRLPIAQFARRLGWRALYVAAFVFVFTLPDRLAAKMTMPLLIQHLEFAPEDVGRIRQLLGFLITIIGALLGGAVVARGNLKACLLIFGLLGAVSNAGFWMLSVSDQDRTLMAVVIGIESFCGGLVTAGFVAYLMSLCDRAYSATQYALLSSLLALSSAAAGPLAGQLVDLLNYPGFFLVTIVVALPGIVMVPWLPNNDAERRGTPGKNRSNTID